MMVLLRGLAITGVLLIGMSVGTPNVPEGTSEAPVVGVLFTGEAAAQEWVCRTCEDGPMEVCVAVVEIAYGVYMCVETEWTEEDYHWFLGECESSGSPDCYRCGGESGCHIQGDETDLEAEGLCDTHIECEGLAMLRMEIEKVLLAGEMSAVGTFVADSEHVTFNAARGAIQLMSPCNPGEVARHYPLTGEQMRQLEQWERPRTIRATAMLTAT